MKYNYGPRGVLQVDDARITFKNFAGRGDRYNHEGDRNFALIIPNEDIANELIADGWNVKIKPPREDGDSAFIYMNIKLSYNGRGGIPAYLRSGDKIVELTEDTIGCLDNMDIMSVDLDIRPYDWTRPNGDSGRSAYLQSIHVTQAIDRFAARYRNNED